MILATIKLLMISCVFGTCSVCIIGKMSIHIYIYTYIHIYITWYIYNLFLHVFIEIVVYQSICISIYLHIYIYIYIYRYVRPSSFLYMTPLRRVAYVEWRKCVVVPHVRFWTGPGWPGLVDRPGPFQNCPFPDWSL